MKQRIIISLATVLVFAAGFLSGMWTERHRPLPPPPWRLGGEHMRQGPLVGPGPASRRDWPANRAELLARVKELQPQLETYLAHMKVIDDAFNRDFDAVLKPEQRARHDEYLKRHAALSQDRNADGTALTEDQVLDLMRSQAQGVLFEVDVPLRLEFLSHIYRLDDVQRDKVHSLLKIRRDKVLDLMDTSPSPSALLSRLAFFVQHIGPPPPRIDQGKPGPEK